MKFLRPGLATLLILTFLATPALAGTAFQTQSIAEKLLSPSARGKLIWARATEGKGVDPSDWSYLFYDPYADHNGRYVEVKDGAVVKIEQGFVEIGHLRVASYKESEIMLPDKLKLDSDRALQAVQAAANIENVPLSTVHYELQMNTQNNVPCWKLTLSTMKGDDEVEFCSASLSALTGQVFTLKVNHDK